jgi:hypothetical protein
LEFVVSRLTTVLASRRYADPAALLTVERKLRVPLDWSEGPEGALQSIRRLVNDREYFLDLVDLLLSGLSTTYREQVSRDIEKQLKEGGSAWSVRLSDQGVYRLVRRVDPTVTASAQAVMSASGRAGQHLAKAWQEIYGRNPDPSTAYREAVRAVEAVGIPVISPKNPKATLGTMIKDIENAPTKWTVVLKPKAGDSVLMIRQTMELLWTAELDRHGTADETVPLHVSAEEAEGAIHLAVTLVHWFHSGAIKAKT